MWVYAPSLAWTGFHPVDGAKFAGESGFSELIVSLVAFHSGAEFEARERGQESLLAAFTRPPRDLLDRVTYCDMTIGPDGSLLDGLADVVPATGERPELIVATFDQKYPPLVVDDDR